MRLDDYAEPKGAYYVPALVATFADQTDAEAAIESLHAAGFTTRDIDVAREDGGITIVVSEAMPGMLEQARALLAASAATDVHPYGAGAGRL